MAERSASVGLGKDVEALGLPVTIIDEMVKRAVDRLYEDNMVVTGIYIKTFTLVLNGQEVPIGVFVTEENGVDKCLVLTKKEYEEKRIPNKPEWPTKRV